MSEHVCNVCFQPMTEHHDPSYMPPRCCAGCGCGEERPGDCPVCAGSTRGPLFWSKAGLTYQLCDECKTEAREQRRDAYRAVRL